MSSGGVSVCVCLPYLYLLPKISSKMATVCPRMCAAEVPSIHSQLCWKTNFNLHVCVCACHSYASASPGNDLRSPHLFGQRRTQPTMDALNLWFNVNVINAEATNRPHNWNWNSFWWISYTNWRILFFIGAGRVNAQQRKKWHSATNDNNNNNERGCCGNIYQPFGTFGCLATLAIHFLPTQSNLAWLSVPVEGTRTHQRRVKLWSFFWWPLKPFCVSNASAAENVFQQNLYKLVAILITIYAS